MFDMDVREPGLAKNDEGAAGEGIGGPLGLRNPSEIAELVRVVDRMRFLPPDWPVLHRRRRIAAILW